MSLAFEILADIIRKKAKKLTLRSRDMRPQYYGMISDSMDLITVPRKEWSRYSPREIVVTVFYRVPVLGTSGETIMSQEFETHTARFDNRDAGYKFYRQKLASYNARHAARHQRFYDKNRAYFDKLESMRPKAR